MPEKSRPNIRFYKELAEKNPAELEKVKQDFYRTLKLDHPLERVVKLTREAVDEEKREVTLSLSSEEPVERFFGIEVLGHDPTEIDSSRLEASAPWLWMHDWLDQRGVIASWEVKDKKLRVKVRLSRNPKGEELLRDMVDGITPNTSVGYMIEKVKEVTPKDAPRDAPRVFRVVRWMPYEGSSVTVPADITVGLGRSMNDQATPQERPMNEKQLKALQARRDAGEQLPALIRPPRRRWTWPAPATRRWRPSVSAWPRSTPSPKRSPTTTRSPSSFARASRKATTPATSTSVPWRPWARPRRWTRPAARPTRPSA
jgi:hypothetical protein